jgi:hypothetical protein
VQGEGGDDRLKEFVKVEEPGDSEFEAGKIVTNEAFEERAHLKADTKVVPTYQSPMPATCGTQLLGITKAAVQSDNGVSPL